TRFLHRRRPLLPPPRSPPILRFLIPSNKATTSPCSTPPPLIFLPTNTPPYMSLEENRWCMRLPCRPWIPWL
ncbi:hypothetical protein HMI56_002122, partial [Coelomomyces lativittatus]